MSLLFDPLYPTVVQYVVSQSIWELYEIHFWQVLFGMWGKNKAFLTLQHRYEKKHYEKTAFIFLVVVFVLSFLIQRLMVWRQTNQTIVLPTEQPNNPNQPNEANGAINDNNLSAGNQQPNPEHNEH